MLWIATFVLVAVAIALLAIGGSVTNPPGGQTIWEVAGVIAALGCVVTAVASSYVEQPNQP